MRLLRIALVPLVCLGLLFFLPAAALAQGSPPADYAAGCESRGGTVYATEGGWDCRPPPGSCGDGTDPYQKNGAWMCTGDTHYMWAGQTCPEGMRPTTTPEGNRTCEMVCADGSAPIREPDPDGTSSDGYRYRCSSGSGSMGQTSDTPPPHACPEGGEWGRHPQHGWVCYQPCPEGTTQGTTPSGERACFHGDAPAPGFGSAQPTCPTGEAATRGDDGAWRCGDAEFREGADGTLSLYCGDRPCTPEDFGMTHADDAEAAGDAGAPAGPGADAMPGDTANETPVGALVPLAALALAAFAAARRR
ncbi:MAG TPA: hypothetical protein VFH78_07790 [Candidatus Thermoplasmatota archaeon]|nr:hypothetical protein [Candidatus Thermoplasmatota archaeon]